MMLVYPKSKFFALNLVVQSLGSMICEVNRGVTTCVHAKLLKLNNSETRLVLPVRKFTRQVGMCQNEDYVILRKNKHTKSLIMHKQSSIFLKLIFSRQQICLSANHSAKIGIENKAENNYHDICANEYLRLLQNNFEEYMSAKPMSLAEKLDLLFAMRPKANGDRLTYEEIQLATGIRPSTISRMRSGQNSDPTFRTISGLAEVFNVPLRFFSSDMTTESAHTFLRELGTSEKKATETERNRQQTAERLAMLALRASQMDDSTISVLNEMIDYVVQQQNIDLGRLQSNS